MVVELADRKIFDEDIGLSGQGTNDLAALGVLQVDAYGALRAVECHVVSADGITVALDEWLKAAGFITALRLLDFNDGSAEFGQDHAGEWASQDAREVENSQMS